MPRIVHGTKDAKAIGRRFKQAREQAGLSQRQLAAATTMTGAYISRIEAGDRTPTLDAIRAFAEPLGVSPEWLETGTVSNGNGSVSPLVTLRALRQAREALDRAAALIDRQIAALDQ